jgi:hypothetical protein
MRPGITAGPVTATSLWKEIMKHDPVLSAVDCAMSVYLMMNRHSREEEQTARSTLKLHFDRLVAGGEDEQERLVVKGLTLLRQLDERKPARVVI